MVEQCPNCSAELHGQFCFACGQNQKAIDRHFFSLVSEALEDVLTPTSKTAKTLSAICFKPGYLTKQYFSGRKASYIQPVRLYFITSIAFFFVASMFFTPAATITDSSGDAINIEGDITFTDDDGIDHPVNIEWAFLSEEDAQALNAHLESQVKKAIQLVQDDPGEAQEKLLDAAPPLIFCLLPFFALLLKFTYLGSGRYYTEHLVLSLHNHSFIFIALLADHLIDLLPAGTARDWVSTPIEIWTPLYLLLSLKVTYQQGWVKTILKFFLLGICYSAVFLLASTVTVILGVIFL